jgi:vacuolar-type H+-ATPase catalytic subunit A/Vma1
LGTETRFNFWRSRFSQAGDFEEPVTQATLAVVRLFWDFQERSDFVVPAIDPQISWSKYVGEVENT